MERILEIRIGFETGQLRRAIRELGSRAAETAATQAINRTITGLRTDATRALAPKTQIRKQSIIRKRMILKKASRSTLRGALIIPPTSIPLSGVKGVRVTRKGARFKGKLIPAFRIKGSVGALSNDIFIRRKGRKSFQRAFSYTLVQEYHRHDIPDVLQRAAGVRLQKAWQSAFNNQKRRLGFR